MNIEEKRQIATAWFRAEASLDADEPLTASELSAIVATHVPYFENSETTGSAFAVLKEGQEEAEADFVVFIDENGVVVDEFYLTK